jgi:hypothetical protein
MTTSKYLASESISASLKLDSIAAKIYVRAVGSAETMLIPITHMIAKINV